MSRPEYGNRTVRVTTCDECGADVTAGRRGPLPRRCAACKQGDELKHRIATARNVALEQDRADVAVALDKAGTVLTPDWTRYGE